MKRPKLLDLFCCQGGAGEGYRRAGFDVTGVDRDPQPRYPFEFIQADAEKVLRDRDFLAGFDAIHTSPPCQGYTALKAVHGNEHPLLIDPVRELLEETGKPYVIENVIGAPMRDPIKLCGEMFGLGVIRHRLFEVNWPLPQLPHPKHRGRVRGWRHGVYYDGPYVAVYGDGGGKGSTEEWATAMGIHWMDRDGLREAIPPAYSEYVGKWLLPHIVSDTPLAV